ncbi:MAG: three-Cys-motif partner protein TcmP [Bacteroidetes bacterium]|nr:three-Cys-motif partner protein TcmP [Bacteroidota bacterium]
MSHDHHRHEFGGPWTEQKLTCLKKYLDAYMTILRRHPWFSTVYIDAFAGTGYRTMETNSTSASLFDEPSLDHEATAYLKGSPAIALGLAQPFDKYIFIDQKETHTLELEKLREEFPALSDRIVIERSDANVYLAKYCAETNWSRTRAVVFLDPYGMQVAWDTVEAIARTKAIDLWYLFPYMAFNRMLTRQGPPPAAWANRITHVIGIDTWQSVFYSTEQLSIFSDDATRRSTTLERIRQFIVERLKTIFPAVCNKPMILYNSINGPLFVLCFATASPKKSVQDAALKIAGHILDNG